MPLIAYKDDETRKFFLDHIVTSKYNFKYASIHGLDKTEEIGAISKYDKILDDINVSI
jgi:hypothetical protein